MKAISTPVLNALAQEYVYVDNELQDGTRRVGLFASLSRQGVHKRSGERVPQLVFAVLVWPFLGVKSVSSFCGKFIGAFIDGGIDVIYRFLRRENINWRAISGATAKRVYDQQQLGSEADSAFAVDDSLKHRRGRKVEGVSSHFDHTERRHVMGQQVLQLGLATAKGFLPVDQQIYIGSKKVQGLQGPFEDERSAVARDYKCALEQDKNQMFRAMLKRAMRRGIRSPHVVGDTWFGTKGNIRAVIEQTLIAVFMMKRGNMTYRFQGRDYTAKMLYELVKRRMRAGKGQRFLTHAITVQIDLAQEGQPPEWTAVKLVFSKPRKCGKDSWVVLLCSQPRYAVEQVLRVYALRWSIEVYFKEVKQAMGWLKEQTGRYTVHYASIHLAAIRYMIIYNLMLANGQLTFGEMRNRLTGSIEKLSFAAVLWELFKALIYGVLDRFRKLLGNDMLTAIKKAVDATVEQFLQEALQLDEESIQAQLKAEELGVL